MRTLYYVPMVHQEWECDAEADPSHGLRTAEQHDAHGAFVDKYVEWVSQELL